METMAGEQNISLSTGTRNYTPVVWMSEFFFGGGGGGGEVCLFVCLFVFKYVYSCVQYGNLKSLVRFICYK